MQPLAQHKQRQHPRRRARSPVRAEDHRKGQKVEGQEEVLREPDVGPRGRQSVEQPVEVDVQARVDQGPRGAGQERVGAFAGEVEADLVHVGDPVDFGVCGVRGLGGIVEFLDVFFKGVQGIFWMMRRPRAASERRRSGLIQVLCLGF